MSLLRSCRWFGALAIVMYCLPGLHAAESGIDSNKLVGVWLYKDVALAGGFEGYTICKADGTQVNIAYFTKLNKWLYEEFTWKLEGRTLTATETHTNIPGLAQGKVSTSEIVRVDDTTLVCRERDGEHTETKVDKLPDLFKTKLGELQRAEAAAHGTQDSHAK